MILISAPSAESMMLSAHAESIIISAGSTKQQSTKSCHGKCNNDGGGIGDSGGGNRFDVGSSNDNCSDDSIGDGDGDSDGGNGYSSNDDSNSNIGGCNSNSGGKNINQLNAAAEKAAMVGNVALASTLLAS
jgi:hypothetical protein